MAEQIEKDSRGELVKLELTPVVNDARVQIYRDELKHLHIYYGGVYRCVLSAGFHRDAEVSFWDSRHYLEIRSMGQGIMRFPFRYDAKYDEDLDSEIRDDWPDEIEDIYGRIK